MTAGGHEAADNRAADLDLCFASGPSGTWLKQRHVRYPYALTGTFASPDGALTAIPQSISGGLFDGDRLVERVAVEEGATVRLEEPAARVCHSRRSDGARLHREARCAPQSSLVWAGQPLVLLPGADVTLTTRISLASGALMCWLDLFGAHAPAGFQTTSPQPDKHLPTPLRGRASLSGGVEGAPGTTCLMTSLSINDPDGRPVAETAARVVLDGRSDWFGTLLLLSDSRARQDAWLAAIDPLGADASVGIDRLPGDIGLVVQAMGTDADGLVRRLRALLDAAGSLPAADPLWDAPVAVQDRGLPA